MPEFAVVLNFDSTTEDKLNRLQATLRSHGIKPQETPTYTCPHITLTSFRSSHPAKVVQRLRAWAQNESPLDITLAAVGTFPGTENAVYIAPTATCELAQLHQKCLASLNGQATLLKDHYKAKLWMPHSTVALYIPQAQIALAVSLCRQSDVFGPAKLVKATLLKFPSAEQIEVYPLG